MFEKASRLKIRYFTSRGGVTVEDLWDIPLTDVSGFSLDNIAKQLNKELKETAEESFVVKNTKNEVAELKFEIVKHVIGVRLAGAAAEKDRVEAKKKSEKILAIIEKKQDAKLESADIATLKGML